MASIKHLLHINAPASKVYEAITTINGLANWWTTQTSGDAIPGGIIRFRFNQAGCDMRVSSVVPGASTEWICTDGWPDWIGTTINFQMEEHEGKTRVRFEHGNWKEANDFFAGCSFSWGRFLESLKQYCQTGTGEAFGAGTYRQ